MLLTFDRRSLWRPSQAGPSPAVCGFRVKASLASGALSDPSQNSQQQVVATGVQGKPGDYYKSTYTTIGNGCQGLILGHQRKKTSKDYMGASNTALRVQGSVDKKTDKQINQKPVSRTEPRFTDSFRVADHAGTVALWLESKTARPRSA